MQPKCITFYPLIYVLIEVISHTLKLYTLWDPILYAH